MDKLYDTKDKKKYLESFEGKKNMTTNLYSHCFIIGCGDVCNPLCNNMSI